MEKELEYINKYKLSIKMEIIQFQLEILMNIL